MIEKVNPCHPDKVADRIAGAIVDLAYSKVENPKIAVEVLLGHGVANIIIESSVDISQTETEAIVSRITKRGCVKTLLFLKNHKALTFTSQGFAMSKSCCNFRP